MNKEKFRGLRKVVMVSVLEGNGGDIPYREVHYVYDLEQHGGSHGGLVGVIDPYEKNQMEKEANCIVKDILKP